MNLSIIVAFMCILKVFSQNFVSAEASEQREITGSVNNESSLVTTMSVNQSPISQSLKRASQFAEPILSNFLLLLKNLNKVTRELGDSAPEREFNNFVTSTRYVNFRMVTLEEDYFAPKYIPKELSLLRARKDCMWSCANNQSCLAFNLYDTENYYVCEMLPDNLCVNRTRIAFAEWPGSTVWEKMSTGMQQSCVDASFPVGNDIPCEVLRPGCFGKWPQCSNCLRTCWDSDMMYNYVERDFVIWPDGIGPFKLPTFARCFKEMLQNVSKSVSLLQDAGAEEAWKNFTTSRRYKNFRMITSETDYFAHVNISKKLTLLHAKEECIWLCNKNESCVAFNVYESEDYFVCERLPDNLCENRTRIAFAAWPGSTVWEKLSTGMQQSCVDARFPFGNDIPCEVLRPGCFGTWPQCSNCLRTCKDSRKLYSYEEKEFTLWPEGDGDFVLPIFALCRVNAVVMLKRVVNVANARLAYDYRMSLKDMHRISRLNVFSFILFEFFTTTDVHYYVKYINWQITANGMLANLTLYGTQNMKDIFNLNGRALKPTPFVTVTDDRFGCGSFWLLDSKNATHCPGGQVSMLGKLKVEGGKVISTGMSIPEATQENEMIRLVRFRTAY